MPKYLVGKPYRDGCTPWAEASSYAYRLDGHELILIVRGVTARQEDDLRCGSVDLALVADEREIVLCSRFGESLPWAHSDPFHCRDVPPAWRGMLPSPEPMPRLRPHLRVILVEADTGLVRALRTVFLPPSFASALDDALRGQAGPPVDPDHGEWPVARISVLTSFGLPGMVGRPPGHAFKQELT
jgi:hypothetical protein